MIRPQYHFRTIDGHLCAWDVRKLLAQTAELPVREVAVADIAEMDEAYWFEETKDTPTCRKITEHALLIAAADLRWPILLCAEGRVMDGMHRVCKALSEGRATLPAVRLRETPPPDFIDVPPGDLPYAD